MRIVFCMVLAVASAALAFADPTFRVTVTDSSGSIIPGAMVSFHWDPAGSSVGLRSNVGIEKDLVLKTDSKGTVVAELPPGFYDLFVSAMAFTPGCRKIRLNGTAPSEVAIRLAVDPLVTKELGDTFEALPPKP